MNFRATTTAGIACAAALTLVGMTPAIAAETPAQETYYTCAITEGSTITWTPARNILKNSYAKHHEFTGAVRAEGENVWRSEYAHVWQIDPAASSVVIGPTGKIESGEIRALPSNLAVTLRNTSGSYLVNTNVFNPYIRIVDGANLVAGLGTDWADANNGKSARTEPADVLAGEYQFSVNDEHTHGTLSPRTDSLGAPVQHFWTVAADTPVAEAARVAFRGLKENQPFERVSADLNFSCQAAQRDVVAETPDDTAPGAGGAATDDRSVKYCAVKESSTFAWGVKRSWRDYLVTLASGRAERSGNITERLWEVQPNETLGYEDSKLTGKGALPRQSRYQNLFPIDAQRSFVTLDADNNIVDMKVRTAGSWVRYISEDHGFDNAISTPEVYIAGDQLKVALTPDVVMTPRGGGDQITKVGGHSEFLRGTFTHNLASDLTHLSIGHTITGADSRNRLQSSAVYTKNDDSALVFAGTYDDGVEADPVTMELDLDCRDITPENPKPEDQGVNAPAPVTRTADDQDAADNAGDTNETGAGSDNGTSAGTGANTGDETPGEGTENGNTTDNGTASGSGNTAGADNSQDTGTTTDNTSATDATADAGNNTDAEKPADTATTGEANTATTTPKEDKADTAGSTPVEENGSTSSEATPSGTSANTANVSNTEATTAAPKTNTAASPQKADTPFVFGKSAPAFIELPVFDLSQLPAQKPADKAGDKPVQKAQKDVQKTQQSSASVPALAKTGAHTQMILCGAWLMLLAGAFATKRPVLNRR